MDLNELKASGILELYVLGLASPEEVNTVESFLVKDPGLRSELAEIENALEIYAKTTAVHPSPQTKADLLSKLNDKTPTSNSSSKNSGIAGFQAFLIGLMGIGLLGLSYVLFNNYKSLTDLQYTYTALIEQCDSLQTQDSILIDRYNQIKAPANNIININPTEKYPATNLFFITNPESQRNFIQIKNLPAIAANQSYQLWSLKGQDAIPLDVFQGIGDNLIEVLFEPNTDAYAITIEPLGGSQTPSLDNLIGVIPLS
jgi:anti-sigma-K factor RskA